MKPMLMLYLLYSFSIKIFRCHLNRGDKTTPPSVPLPIWSLEVISINDFQYDAANLAPIKHINNILYPKQNTVNLWEMNIENFIVCFGYGWFGLNAATGWGHIIPFNHLWNFIVVCVALGCITNKQHTISLPHWYNQLLRQRYYVTFMQAC